MGSQAFTADGTFTVPAGVTSIVVHCLGPSGNGGSGSGGTAGGGGGGGAYGRKTLATSAGTQYTVNVGAAPGDHSYIEAVLDPGVHLCEGVSGNDGATPTGGIGGDAAACIGDATFSGGTGADGDGTNGGGGGGAAGTTGNGNNGSGATGGASGANAWTPAVSWAASNGGAGATGSDPGAAGGQPGSGGGGGGPTDGAGGTGRRGEVYFHWEDSGPPFGTDMQPIGGIIQHWRKREVVCY